MHSGPHCSDDSKALIWLPAQTAAHCFLQASKQADWAHVLSKSHGKECGTSAHLRSVPGRCCSLQMSAGTARSTLAWAWQRCARLRSCAMLYPCNKHQYGSRTRCLTRGSAGMDRLCHGLQYNRGSRLL